MSDQESVQAEMPKYKCHKEVWALKIKLVQPSSGNKPTDENGETDGGLIFTPEDTFYAPFKVDRDFVRKHQPHEGGYYIVYKDGYKSFSPATAFEEGYSKI